MQLPIRKVDAFVSAAFTGNPAAVCPLEAWLPEALMQAIAAENNLSETAFLVPTDHALPRGPRGPAETAETAQWDLRWFTPKVEVDLCGHATLAAGFVVLEELAPRAARVRFHTKSGPLVVERAGDELGLDLPAKPPRPAGELSAGYRAALGATPRETLVADYKLCVFESADEVRALAPEMTALARVEPQAVICTARGDEPGVDFVSRFFAPSKGVPEDPVTGSAHCTLTPFWSARLGRRELRARQLSPRGGSLRCRDEGERVRLFGRVAPYLCGTIEVPG